jgi:hypothetical protein
MNYLQDAINKIEQSEGDVTNNYQEVLIRQAQLRLQISIALSLETIAKELMQLNGGEDERAFKNAIQKLYGS